MPLRRLLKFNFYFADSTAFREHRGRGDVMAAR